MCWLNSVRRMSVAAGLIVVLYAIVAAAKEARPPEWPRDVVDAFFVDAREKLVGERPDYGAQLKPDRTASASGLQHASEAALSDRSHWSNLISADALETEVKRLSQSLAGSVTSPSAFKGGGYKDARRELSELAVLFAVTAQYQGAARWQDTAAGMRDLLSRAAAHLKVGSDATYREAVARRDDLAELVRGARPQVPVADAVVDDWSQVSARPPLMQRLNIAHQERLTKWLADEPTFRRQRDEVAHEAQIVALLADVIRRNRFEFSDDETYVGYAGMLGDAASEISAAGKSGDFGRARDAAGRATNACADCHDGYRG